MTSSFFGNFKKVDVAAFVALLLLLMSWWWLSTAPPISCSPVNTGLQIREDGGHFVAVSPNTERSLNVHVAQAPVKRLK